MEKTAFSPRASDPEDMAVGLRTWGSSSSASASLKRQDVRPQRKSAELGDKWLADHS